MNIFEFILYQIKWFIYCNWKYGKYVFRHKYYVFTECYKRGIPIRGLFHDWHKFLPVEWFPYAYYFYHENGTLFNGDTYWHYKHHMQIEQDFTKAWLSHQKRGKHHWQYWILLKDNTPFHKRLDIENALPIPDKIIKEMVSDWIGAGRAIHGNDDAMNWYQQNKDKMILHPDSRMKVELLLNKHECERTVL